MDFKWLTKHFSRAKREYSTSLKRSRNPISHVRKKTSTRVKIGRPLGVPTDKLTLQIEKGLKEKYRDFCDTRKMSISFAVSAHMKEDLAHEASLAYQAHLAMRHKPKKKKA